MLLKEYTEIFEPTQHQPHLLPYIIDQNVFRLGGRTCTLCDHYFNDVPNAKKQIDPDIDLYLHKIKPNLLLRFEETCNKLVK